MILKKEPQMENTGQNKEEKPRRDKSNFFYKDKWFKQRGLEEKMKKDVDFKAFHSDRW